MVVVLEQVNVNIICKLGSLLSLYTSLKEANKQLNKQTNEWTVYYVVNRVCYN